MKDSVRKEIEIIIREKPYTTRPSAEEYRDDGAFSVGWLCMISDYDLSEDLLKEFKHSFLQCHWNEVCRYQNLSKGFIYEMEDYLDMKELIGRGLVSREEHKDYKEEIFEPILDRLEILDL